jgi:hypothetical protein
LLARRERGNSAAAHMPHRGSCMATILQFNA